MSIPYKNRREVDCCATCEHSKLHPHDAGYRICIRHDNDSRIMLSWEICDNYEPRK